MTSTTDRAPLAWRWYSGFQKSCGVCCWQAKKAASGALGWVTKASENDTIASPPPGSRAGAREVKRRIGLEPAGGEHLLILARVVGREHQHGHALAPAEEPGIEAAEAEVLAPGRRYPRAIGNREQLEEIAVQLGQVVGGAEGLLSARRQGEPQTLVERSGALQVVDAEHQMVDGMLHG